MRDLELTVQALGALSLALWLTTYAFRLGTVARRWTLTSAFVVFGLALLLALFQTVAYFWR